MINILFYGESSFSNFSGYLVLSCNKQYNSFHEARVAEVDIRYGIIVFNLETRGIKFEFYYLVYRTFLP